MILLDVLSIGLLVMSIFLLNVKLFAIAVGSFMLPTLRATFS